MVEIEKYLVFINFLISSLRQPQYHLAYHYYYYYYYAPSTTTTTDYLSDLVEILLYYILPPEDFSNAPLCAAVLEILVSSVILPLVTLVSDPDYINTLIIWAVSTGSCKSDGGW